MDESNTVSFRSLHKLMDPVLHFFYSIRRTYNGVGVSVASLGVFNALLYSSYVYILVCFLFNVAKHSGKFSPVKSCFPICVLNFDPNIQVQCLWLATLGCPHAYLYTCIT